MTQSSDPVRQFLRHAVATAAYRGAKPLRNAPEPFANYRCCDGARTPIKILAHVSDLFDWALSIAQGKQSWHDSAPLSWPAEVDRFFSSVKRFDDYLASAEPLHAAPEKLFQGPIADALSHIGQLAMLRRLAGAPIKGENYYQADISPGRVGLEQATPRREFD
jgi:hypothetical protein